MSMDNKTNSIKLLGHYLPCSKDSISLALKKRRDDILKGKPKKLIGEVLLDLKIIERKDILDKALNKQRAERLGLCPLFKLLDDEKLSSLAEIFAERSLYANNQFIFAGEYDPTIYILVSGKLEVFTYDKNKKETHIAFVEPVEPIGEMGYFQEGKRTASVRTVYPSEFLHAPYNKLTHYFESEPLVAHSFVEIIQQREDENEKTLYKKNKEST